MQIIQNLHWKRLRIWIVNIGKWNKEKWDGCYRAVFFDA